MKTQNVLMALMAACLISAAVTYWAVRGTQSQVKPAAVSSYALPDAAVPQAAPVPAAMPPKPALSREQVDTLFGVPADIRQNKTVEAFIKAMQEQPPFAGPGTRGYPVVVAQEGQYEKAMQLAEKWIQDYPDSADAYYMQAWIFARTGNYEAAVQVCNAMLAKGPDFGKLRYLLVWINARRQQYDAALKACDEALAAEPVNFGLYYGKGRILDVLGRNDEALAAYSRAIELKADFDDAYLFRGLLYTVLGQYEKAINDQKEAVRLNKYDPAGYLGLGLIYDQIGDYTQAVEQMKNAIMLGSLASRTTAAKQPLTAGIGINDALIYNKIGLLYLKLELYDDARAAFQDSIVTGPPTADAYRGLSLAYWMLGAKDAALENCKILERLDAQGATAVAELINQ